MYTPMYLINLKLLMQQFPILSFTLGASRALDFYKKIMNCFGALSVWLCISRTN